MVSAGLILLAAFFWALAWTLQFRFGWIRIGFIRNNPSFWQAAISSSHAKTVGGYKIDGFHLMQSVAICLLLLAPVLYRPIPIYRSITENAWWIDYLILGTIWIIAFERFYNLIAPRPKKQQ